MENPKSEQRRALVLIDFQRDFVDDAGRMPMARGQAPGVLAAAERAVRASRAAGDLVVAIGNEFRPRDLVMNLLRRGASVRGSEGSRWTERLPIDGIPYFPKWAGSAFVNPAFEAWLRAENVGELVLTGVMAKACVTATAKDALAKGYVVRVREDAVGCFSDRSRERAFARLRASGVEMEREAA